ncbi:MAG TPA: autotransporter outer membrane beta-barrel domain-containing protein [Roseiarcus sp.]
MLEGSVGLEKADLGTLILTGANTYTGGTEIDGGALQVSADANLGAASGPLSFDGGILATTATFTTARAATLNSGGGVFDVAPSTTLTVSGAIGGLGALTKTDAGTLILTADNPYTGGTIVSAGTLAVGDSAHSSAALSGGGPITIGSGGTLGGYGSVTGSVVNDGVVAAGNATPGFGDPPPTGTFIIIGDLLNRGAVQLGSGASIGNVLQVNGNYVGASGALAVNTFLGNDSSPSDRLVISGGAATGETFVHVTNIGGPGAQTTNGIQVVSAITGATTTPGAFALAAGELRAGAFDYDLFRGGLNPSNFANDWFLRSTFMAPPQSGSGPQPPTSQPQPPIVAPIPPFPSRPPLDPLPPGVLFPIIGPELATYGVVQPLARQLGLAILGTLDDRVGDTYEPDACAVQHGARRLADKEAGDDTRAVPAVFTLGLGPLLRPDDRQPLSGVCRSARQREHGRLPGWH